MNEVVRWVAGPQIVGLVFLITGYILWFFPPKNINDLYGYRTAGSKKNQKAWDAANYYSALLIINMGYFAVIAGLLMAWLVPVKYVVVTPIASAVTGVGCAAILIFKTERHIKNIK